jgi:hypothetical protein
MILVGLCPATDPLINTLVGQNSGGATKRQTAVAMVWSICACPPHFSSLTCLTLNQTASRISPFPNRSRLPNHLGTRTV